MSILWNKRKNSRRLRHLTGSWIRLQRWRNRIQLPVRSYLKEFFHKKKLSERKRYRKTPIIILHRNPGASRRFDIQGPTPTVDTKPPSSLCRSDTVDCPLQYSRSSTSFCKMYGKNSFSYWKLLNEEVAWFATTLILVGQWTAYAVICWAKRFSRHKWQGLSGASELLDCCSDVTWRHIKFWMKNRIG